MLGYSCAPHTWQSYFTFPHSVSLSILCWPRTHSDLPVSTSRLLASQGTRHHAGHGMSVLKRYE